MKQTIDLSEKGKKVMIEIGEFIREKLHISSDLAIDSIELSLTDTTKIKD